MAEFFFPQIAVAALCAAICGKIIPVASKEMAAGKLTMMVKDLKYFVKSIVLCDISMFIFLFSLVSNQRHFCFNTVKFHAILPVLFSKSIFRLTKW